MRPNKIRQMLTDGQPTMCARTATVWPDVVELIGSLGIYDYVEYAAEYGTFGLPDLDNYCRAAELWGLGTMIKLDQDPRVFMAQRAIGSGFESVLFVDCRSVEDVAHCIQICRPETPVDGGLFGAAGRRFAYSGSGHEEFVQALRDVVVAVMVEKAVLVEQLDDVLALPGLDMVQWGPTDYTMSSGLYTQRNHQAEVKKVERHVLETCLAKGIAPRVEMQSLENLEYYLEMGIQHFRIGHDMGVLKAYWQSEGTSLRDALKRA